MTSFSPLNFYAFLAARGEFLRPDVRALLDGAPVGPFSMITIRFGRTVLSMPHPQSAGVRKRLDALLFSEGLPRQNDTQELDGLQSDQKVRCEALQMRMSPPELVWHAKQRAECSRWPGCACTGCREVIVGHHSPSSRLSSSD